MNYCCWSSDDWMCDVYVYAHVHGGFRIHVAARRVEYREPLPPRVGSEDAWYARHKAVMDLHEQSPKSEIGLPHDGETSYPSTAGDCADQLDHLASLGYNVPGYAIENLRAEAEEEG